MSEKIPQNSENFQDRVVDLLHSESDDVFVSASMKFIDERLAQLEQESEPRGVGPLDTRHIGFLHPDSEIRSQALMPGFHVDDPDIYLAALTTMKDLHEKPVWQDPAKYRKLVFFSVQYALDRYFGNTFPSSEQQTERTTKIWNNDIVSDDEPAESLSSIADYKNIALCAERAAAANNMLCLFGIEPEMVIGNLEQEGKSSELHAFLITENPLGKKLIFDPTHPTISKKDQSMTIKPFIVKGGDAFLAGETVEITHTDNIDGENVSRLYKYTPSPVGLLAA